jgi:hypothetical protein
MALLGGPSRAGAHRLAMDVPAAVNTAAGCVWFARLNAVQTPAAAVGMVADRRHGVTRQLTGLMSHKQHTTWPLKASRTTSWRLPFIVRYRFSSTLQH